ncbi:MAG: CAP domain-containing protein [Ruminococcaceae bacterium]|nr:CAP domain-containing protein [Oscillospiraceae bacterium]
MRKLIILLLCCGVLVSMVGCGDNTAPPPTESPPTMVSETVITETPTETTPPVTAVEPTEKEKESVPTESADQTTEPTTTATEPTTTAKTKEKPKATETSKPTEPSAAEKPKKNGCITIVETDDPPTEEIIIPPKPSADLVAQKVAEYINQFRTEQGDVTATVIPGLTEYCKYRCTQLKTKFAHDTTDQRAAAEALQYGEYVDWSLYGIEGEENYYTANVREAIGKGNWGGTADEIAYSIANGFRNSKGHWSYVGSSKYTYMAVGVMYDGYYWYVCVCMDSENTDLK